MSPWRGWAEDCRGAWLTQQVSSPERLNDLDCSRTCLWTIIWLIHPAQQLAFHVGRLRLTMPCAYTSATV